MSDWADGYVAKQYGQQSVLGSYLDPLADKVLIGCLVAVLTYEVGKVLLCHSCFGRPLPSKLVSRQASPMCCSIAMPG